MPLKIRDDDLASRSPVPSLARPRWSPRSALSLLQRHTLMQIDDVYTQHTRESATSPWQFQCQHGPAECRGNKAQSCAIHAIQSSEAVENQQRLTVELVGCAMDRAVRNSAVSVVSQVTLSP